MRNEYRNAMRSKILIKNAYIELLKQKPATKITVTDIIHTANISRGKVFKEIFLINSSILQINIKKNY